jgi:peptide/nickel transport system substrate-binding protein
VGTRDDQPLDILARFGMSDVRMNRRAVLKRALALGLSAPIISALLAACGGDDDDDDTDPTATGAAGDSTPTAGGAATSTTAAGGETPTTGGETPTGGTLVIGRNIDDIVHLDPATAYEISGAPIMWVTYNSMLLAEPDDLNTFNPVLCEETPTVDNGGISADGLVYTFKLKKGIKFSTGTEMTAKDFVFTAKRLWYRQGNPSFLAADLVNDANEVLVEAVDDYTVTYTLKAPNAAFLAIAAGQLTFVGDSAAIAAQGGLDTEAAATDDTAEAWLDQNSVGTGPYTLTSWKKAEEVVTERNANYWGDAVAYDKFVLRYGADSGIQLQQLEAGEIDMAMELDADAVSSLDPEKFDIVEGPLLNHVYIAMMTQDPIGDILTDVRVRQAIGYSIDYDAYVNELRGGAAIRPASAVPLGMLGADKVADLAYVKDLDKAKALLAEAGVEEGTEITLSFGSGSSYEGVSNETTAAKLQADIEQLGLKVTLNPMDPPQRLEDFRAAKLQFTFSEWGPDYLDVHAYAFPFGGVPDQSPSLRIMYVNEDNVPLLEQALQELDVAKREELYVQIMTNMINDAAFIPLWQPISQYAVKKGMQGAVVHALWLTLPERIKPPA